MTTRTPDPDHRTRPTLPTRRQLLGWTAGTAALLAGGPRSRAAPSGTGAAGEAAADAPAFDELRRRLGPRLVGRADPAYEADRRSMVWSAVKPDRRPDAIVHAASEEEVALAVRYAASRGLRVAVRGGGHHFNAPALREGGLLLDLSALDRIAVEPEAKTAAVGPAATGRELLEALAPHRLAFPVGHCPSVPLSGYLLNGGIGWNGGAWGPACASVSALDVVDAGGRALRVDAASHPELLWAARGAGPGFPAVVTRFHLELHPLPAAIRTSTLLFAVDDLDAVAGWLPGFHATLPPEVELLCMVVSPPPAARAEGAPPRVLVVTATAFADDPADAAAWLAPLERGPEGVEPLGGTHLVDTPFEALFASIDAAMPAGHRYAADHVWSDATPREVLAAVREVAVAPPSPRDFLLLAFAPPPRPPGRPATAPALPGMALSTAALYAGVYGVWSDPAGDQANRGWVRAMGEALEPLATGCYIGEADLDAGPDAARRCYSDAAWRRLAAVRRTYDPEGRFYSYPTAAAGSA